MLALGQKTYYLLIKFFLNIIKNKYILFIFANFICIADIIVYQIIRDNLIVALTSSVYIFSIFSLQILFTFLINIFYTKIYKLKDYLLILFLITNIFTIKLVFFDIFYVYESYFKILFFIAIIFGLIFVKKSLITKNIFYVILIAIILSILTSIFNILYFEQKEKVINIEKKLPKFTSFPNIYLIGIDALAPVDILNKEFQYNFEFRTEVEKKFYRFNNSFSSGGTYKTWRDLLDLEFSEERLNNTGRVTGLKTFTGKSPSHLFEIFRSNGYKIHTGFGNPYFGKQKGEFIDEFRFYPINNISNSLTCLNPASFFFIRKYYWLCDKKNFYAQSLFQFFYQSFNEKGYLKNKSVSKQDFFLNYFKKIENPKLFAYHLFLTRHVERGFKKNSEKNYNEFKEQYIKGYKELDLLLFKMIKFIEAKDPDSIVYVFGDHGLLINKKLNIEIKDLLIDQYKVQSFLFRSKNQCVNKLANTNDSYIFIYNTVVKLIECLAEENSFFKKEKSIKNLKGLNIEENLLR